MVSSQWRAVLVFIRICAVRRCPAPDEKWSYGLRLQVVDRGAMLAMRYFMWDGYAQEPSSYVSLSLSLCVSYCVVVAVAAGRACRSDTLMVCPAGCS